jgi:hypothetical protein
MQSRALTLAIALMVGVASGCSKDAQVQPTVDYESITESFTVAQKTLREVLWEIDPELVFVSDVDPDAPDCGDQRRVQRQAWDLDFPSAVDPAGTVEELQAALSTRGFVASPDDTNGWLDAQSRLGVTLVRREIDGRQHVNVAASVPCVPGEPGTRGASEPADDAAAVGLVPDLVGEAGFREAFATTSQDECAFREGIFRAWDVGFETEDGTDALHLFPRFIRPLREQGFTEHREEIDRDDTSLSQFAAPELDMNVTLSRAASNPSRLVVTIESACAPDDGSL